MTGIFLMIQRGARRNDDVTGYAHCDQGLEIDVNSGGLAIGVKSKGGGGEIVGEVEKSRSREGRK